MALFDSGTPLANVELTDTFNTWRVRTNQINTQAAGLASNNVFTGSVNTINNALAVKGPVTAPTVTANTLSFGTATTGTFTGPVTVPTVTANSFVGGTVSGTSGSFTGPITAPIATANSFVGGTVSGTSGSFTGPVTAPVVTANTLTGTISTASQPNITTVGTLASGAISAGFGDINIGANTFTGNGSGLSSLNATNISTGTLASARLPDLAVSDFAAAAIQTSGEGFSDSDTVLMTAAAVDDRILSYGYSTTTGTVTSVGVTAGTGLSGGGTVTTSGSISLAVDLSELTDMTVGMVGTDEFIVLDAGADRRKAANEIGLSIFNNDAGFTTTSGTVTSVAVSGTNITVSGSPITSSGTISISIPQAVGTSSSVQFGSFGVGTAASGTSGEIRATNDITAFYSDDRLKTRVGNIENAVEKVSTLDAFFYEPNETAQELGYEVERRVGVSAQQVQEVLPEAVKPAPIDEQYLTVQYDKLVPLLIQAIKELKQEIEELKK